MDRQTDRQSMCVALHVNTITTNEVAQRIDVTDDTLMPMMFNYCN